MSAHCYRIRKTVECHSPDAIAPLDRDGNPNVEQQRHRHTWPTMAFTCSICKRHVCGWCEGSSFEMELSQLLSDDESEMQFCDECMVALEEAIEAHERFPSMTAPTYSDGGYVSRAMHRIIRAAVASGELRQ